MRFAIILLMATTWFFGLASAAHATLLSEWNLIVKNNVTTISEVDGSTLIGGSLSGTSSYTIHEVTASNGDGLAVGGDITSGNIHINNGGNLRIGGSISGTVDYNGGGHQIVDGSVASMVAADFVYLNQLSQTYALLPANGTLDGGGNLNAVPDVIDGHNVAVYNLLASSFASLGQLNLNIGSADTVILNIGSGGSGTVNFVAPPNLIGGFSQANSPMILWNLYDSTTVTTNNSFSGALLAPNADLQVLGGGINGSVAVLSLSQQNAEIRNYTYTGYVPPVPEPSSFLLMAIAALAFGWRTGAIAKPAEIKIPPRQGSKARPPGSGLTEGRKPS